MIGDEQGGWERLKVSAFISPTGKMSFMCYYDLQSWRSDEDAKIIVTTTGPLGDYKAKMQYVFNL